MKSSIINFILGNIAILQIVKKNYPFIHFKWHLRIMKEQKSTVGIRLANSKIMGICYIVRPFSLVRSWSKRRCVIAGDLGFIILRVSLWSTCVSILRWQKRKFSIWEKSSEKQRFYMFSQEISPFRRLIIGH